MRSSPRRPLSSPDAVAHPLHPLEQPRRRAAVGRKDVGKELLGAADVGGGGSARVEDLALGDEAPPRVEHGGGVKSEV